MAVTYLVQNDDKPDLIFTITFTEQGTSTLKNAGHTTCTLTDAANGVCKYEWGSGDLDTVGIFEGEVQVTYASSKVQTVYAKFDFEIRDELDT
jgi:hypothetical protein